MMLLEVASDALQIGSAGLSVATFVLVLRLSFNAGQLFEKVGEHGRRIDKLEDMRCMADDCPLGRNK